MEIKPPQIRLPAKAAAEVPMPRLRGGLAPTTEVRVVSADQVKVRKAAPKSETK